MFRLRAHRLKRCSDFQHVLEVNFALFDASRLSGGLHHGGDAGGLLGEGSQE